MDTSAVLAGLVGLMVGGLIVWIERLQARIRRLEFDAYYLGVIALASDPAMRELAGQRFAQKRGWTGSTDPQ